MVYFDNAATTMIAPEVLAAMLQYMQDNYGNPGSSHSLGRKAREAVEKARAQVAALIGCNPEQIIFTSGGTEANNLVIQGVGEHLKSIGRTQIITSPTEHISVLKSIEKMCIKEGFGVHYLRVNDRGFVDTSVLKGEITDQTGLVSLMYVNNETGAENPIEDLCRAAKEHGALFFTDCVQAAGYNEIDVERIGCDFLSISSHKMHGPKGVGALYVRDRDKLNPLVCGGDFQEYGIRGGTENVAGIVGFGAACELAKSKQRESMVHTSVLKQTLYSKLFDITSQSDLNTTISFNGDIPIKSGRIINLQINGIDSETLLLMLDSRGFCVSAGSACNSYESKPSHVLLAMGLTDDEAASSIRVSLSDYNTEAEVIEFVYALVDCIRLIKFADTHSNT